MKISSTARQAGTVELVFTPADGGEKRCALPTRQSRIEETDRPTKTAFDGLLTGFCCALAGTGTSFCCSLGFASRS